MALLAQRMKGTISAGAPHLLDVRPALAVHGAGKAQLDQVGHPGQVAQDIERAQVSWVDAAGSGTDVMRHIIALCEKVEGRIRITTKKGDL